MHVDRFDDPAALLAAAAPMLMRREAENCFLLGFLPTLAKSTDAGMWLVRSDNGEPACAALFWPGRAIAVTDAPDEVIDALAAQVAAEGVGLPGVQSRPGVAERFAAAWTRATGARATPGVRMAVHELTTVIPPRRAPGAMRLATTDDVPLVARWADAFTHDIGERLRSGDGRQVAKKRIGRAEIFLWQTDDAGPVSMAAFGGATPNGVRVNLVYTPPAHRGRGYASNCVAALSQRLLDEGRRFCFLYTDLANPTSNKIYREFGYRQVCEDLRMNFESRGT